MSSYTKVGIVIPARYESTRLPGKPLLDLCGKTMIQRTWEQCTKALSPSQVFIATDDARISDHVESFGANVIMTSSSCLTGTDRLAEANAKLELDLVVNVQGDEPIINPVDIKAVITYALQNTGVVVNAIAPVETVEEFNSTTIPKVVKSLDNNLLYMSRSPLPGSKKKVFEFGFKQICIYAFPKESLIEFSRTAVKTPFEEVEDIEILRFLEIGIPVKLIQVSGASMAVDVPEDLVKVRELISTKES